MAETISEMRNSEEIVVRFVSFARVSEHSFHLGVSTKDESQHSVFLSLAFTYKHASEKTEEHRRGKTKWTRKGKEKGKKIGGVSTFWWFASGRRRSREEKWSRQLRHYITNRKRDKENKTLSGRRSTNRTPW